MKTKLIAKQLQRRAITLLSCLFISVSCLAQSIRVAAASNLQSVIKVLSADFTKKTGIAVEPIFGSSGNLSTQIRNGAPYDVFLSADMGYPQKLFDEGFALKEPVFYASGSLVICSTQNLGFNNWERLLLTPRIKKIAIANPTIAPYGRAAEEVLKFKGVLSEIKSKMVFGENVAQVNTYITTGVVDVGFTTQAIVKDDEGKKTIYWKAIDPKTYAPIRQGMVVTKHAKGNANAEKFYLFILSADAKKVFKDYGYTH